MAVGWSPVGGSECARSFLASACHNIPLHFTSGMSANSKVFFPVKGYCYWKKGCIGLSMSLDGWNLSGWRNVWTQARSYLLFEKIQMYKSILFMLFCMDLFILSEEHRLRVLKGSVWSKRKWQENEEMANWGVLWFELLTKYHQNDKIKDGWSGIWCALVVRKAYRVLVGKHKWKSKWENLEIDGRKILKWIWSVWQDVDQIQLT